MTDRATKGLLHVVGGRWVWDANGPVASDETAGVTVATTVTGINDADHETQQANAELIVKRWNAHDALVEALEAVVEASNNAVRAAQAIGRSYTTPPVIQLVEEALEQVK